MKWIFSRKKKQSKPPAVVERLGAKLLTVIQHQQRKLANRLNKATSGWSRARQQIMLYLFCLLFGGVSLVVLVRAVTTPVVKTTIAASQVIRLPVHPKARDTEAERQAQIRELESIQRRIDSMPSDSVPPQVKAQLEALKQLITQ